MRIRINEIKFELNEVFLEAAIFEKLLKKTKLNKADIQSYVIARESIDARKGVVFSYSIDIETSKGDLLIQKGFSKSPELYKSVHHLYEKDLKHLKIEEIDRPVVIGYGPCGIFAAYELACAGLSPIVLEMGEAVDERKVTVDQFWETGILNAKSNVQFGEGGAGAFSDGKLTTRIKDERIEVVLEVLIAHGAPPDIAYKNKPHIGTDILCDVVKRIREKTIDLGGQIYFNTEAIDFDASKGANKTTITCQNGLKFETNHLVLAIGHSSRDTFRQLKDIGLQLERKPFAMGVRIEHPQKLINIVQYGENYNHPKLGAAEYKLTHTTKTNRSVYSFCMCPGGQVVASASEAEGLVINGMSYHSRSLYNANSALLININPEDFESEDVLAGIELQRKLERKAFQMGGSDYHAPVQTVGSFRKSYEKQNEFNASFLENPAMQKRIQFFEKQNHSYEHLFLDYTPTYTPGVKETDLLELFPSYMSEALYEALEVFGRKIPGFDDGRVVLTAVESRSSSPVRICRDMETHQSKTHPGIYPCGEGAGYAGGITSSAVDGIKVAEKIILNLLEKYK